jgi:hypothetical protein
VVGRGSGASVQRSQGNSLCPICGVLVRQVAEPLGPARNYIAGPFAILTVALKANTLHEQASPLRGCNSDLAQYSNTQSLRAAGDENENEAPHQHAAL